MPTLKEIERDYEKAIQIVKENYPDVKEGSPKFWSLVFGVVKRMRGRKSARHLKYLGILSKGEPFDALFYLPYMFSQKVKGIDLFMDLPEHPINSPPSAFPSFPAALSNFVDALRIYMKKRKWNEEEFAERIIERVIEKPLTISLEDDKLTKLLEQNKVALETKEKGVVTDKDIIDWKLVWVYAMLTKRIQPLTPRWGYRLAQLTRDIRDKSLQRLQEHMMGKETKSPLAGHKSVCEIGLTMANTVVLNGKALKDDVRAVLTKEEWRAKSAEEYWVQLRRLFGAIVPAWIAYAYDVLEIMSVEEITFLMKDVLTVNDVLCVFAANEDFLTRENPPRKRKCARSCKASSSETRLSQN